MFFKNLKIGQKMFLGFGFITILMLSVLGYTYFNFTKQSADVDLNLHSYNVIRESDAILVSLINEETGARGFALTGKEEFLEPYNQGKIDYTKHYNNLIQLTSDNFHQEVRLANLNDQYQTWLQWETTQIIDARRKVNDGQMKLEDLIAVAQTGKGKEQTDGLRSILNDIVKEEQGLLQTRHESLVRMQKQTAVILSLGGFTAFLLTVIIAIFVIQMVVDPIRTVTNTFKEISEGDADLEVRLNVNSNDELGHMSKYFNTFMCKLKELIMENRNQSWIKTGQAELGEKISGEQDISNLASNIISYVAKYLDIQIGALYIKTQENTFKLFGSYAYNRSLHSIQEIRTGEGIIGQAALEMKPIIITNVPEDYIKVTSGLGEKIPTNIVVKPLLYEKEVQGVVELGAFKEFTDIQLKFLQQISSVIATAIHSTQARIRIKELLAQTMEQSEELQTQQEELRQNNEELEEQTKVLRESEVHLQRQQEELRVVNEELQERTKTLEVQKNDIVAKNESLRAAQKEVVEKAEALEIASKYKSEFLANMSHELRTPLNSILVLSQMLAEKKDNSPFSAKESEFVKTIHSSGEDLLRLINDVLDLSKVEAGKMDVNLEELNIMELARYLERTFKPVAVKKGLDFKIVVGDRLPDNIISDTQRVRQIVNNLLSNAIKFTHEGGVTVTFHCISNQAVSNLKENNQNFMGISISDSGIGIPLEKQQVIFESFNQSDGTTSRKYGGTGLGLSISKELAKLLGGSISLVSEEGKGSTFTLLLPYEGNKQIQLSENNDVGQGDYLNSINNIQVKDIQVKNRAEESECKDNRYDITTDNKLILIIEDDKSFAGVLTELVHRKGYKCLMAENGKSGIELAAEYTPDAILLDIGLPDINGWKVVQKLKENKKTENIPVHVISGRENNGQPEKMDNVLSYLKKPVSVESLDKVFMEIQDNEKSLKKLLIVDQNKDDLESIVDILKKKGFQIALSECGGEAYKLLMTKSFDCLILDLKLKDMTGFELLEKLKNEDIGNLKIVIHTESELSQEEVLELQRYTQSIIIKGTQSMERLISEVGLFLHGLDSKIEENKIRIIKAKHETKDTLKDKKILLVDDDMRNIFALTSVLEERGLTVVVGRNGKEAIKKLHENPGTHLALMDIMMPDMDGYTAIREIRNQEKFYRMPIIAITAKAMKDDRQKCIDAGANDYLTKPIDIDKLISLLRVWLY
ncbi:response regulator [Clostridium sp. WILCCON 0269]|uniref:Stage 0 sporulation protein A homolog n=1 Tax=Candidatus Clostridium eludens TaxID=3381663 RepID=A0ABW8SKE6_9CLOT